MAGELHSIMDWTERAQLLGSEAELDEQEDPRREGLGRLVRQM